jgi:hypothetical protein
MSVWPLVLLLVYLVMGFIAYRHRYPEGLLPERPSPEAERLRRTGRRRVLPLPARREP